MLAEGFMFIGGGVRWVTTARTMKRGERKKSDDATARRVGVIPPWISVQVCGVAAIFF